MATTFSDELTNKTDGIWRGEDGGILLSDDVAGGIIDYAPGAGKWFIIFNDDRSPIEDIPSQAAAVRAFIQS